MGDESQQGDDENPPEDSSPSIYGGVLIGAGFTYFGYQVVALGVSLVGSVLGDPGAILQGILVPFLTGGLVSAVVPRTTLHEGETDLDRRWAAGAASLAMVVATVTGPVFVPVESVEPLPAMAAWAVGYWVAHRSDS